MSSAKKQQPRRVVRAQYEFPPIGGRVLLSVRQAAAKAGFYETNIYRHLKNKKMKFPRPIKLTAGRTAFFEDEIDRWLESRPRI